MFIVLICFTIAYKLLGVEENRQSWIYFAVKYILMNPGKQKKTFFFFNLFFASGLLDVIDVYKRKHVLDFNT